MINVTFVVSFEIGNRKSSKFHIFNTVLAIWRLFVFLTCEFEGLCHIKNRLLEYTQDMNL